MPEGGFQRDPLAEAFDGAVSDLLDRLWRQRFRGGQATIVALVWSPPGDPLERRAPRIGPRLTVHERAWARSVYHESAGRRPARSVRLEWDGLTPRGRLVYVTMFPKRAGRAFNAEHPERSFTARPELRSTYTGPEGGG